MISSDLSQPRPPSLMLFQYCSSQPEDWREIHRIGWTCVGNGGVPRCRAGPQYTRSLDMLKKMAYVFFLSFSHVPNMHIFSLLLDSDLALCIFKTISATCKVSRAFVFKLFQAVNGRRRLVMLVVFSCSPCLNPSRSSILLHQVGPRAEC